MISSRYFHICVVFCVLAVLSINVAGAKPDNLRRMRRSDAKIDERYRWPNKTIPYWVNMTYFTADHEKQIDKATRVLENVTCLRFVKHSNESDYITFTGDTDHCSSKVGRRGGEQLIKLVTAPVGEDCFDLQTILHEILHSLGFYHAHRRSDRDKYLRIVWDNVAPDWKYKLEKRKDPEDLTDFGVGWDPDSVMHYDKAAYSKNGENTIETLDEKLIDRIGQRDQMSEKDIERVRKMYKCDE